jgi:hydroxymethylpyrimidine pyrophosphatase-like HAD family hydrolase/fructoselysine-6-P-deglycase FrlB-like protein
MARPYEIEMRGLAETFNWATTTDLGPLRRAVQIAGSSPLVAIGSGGSLTAAHALAAFHRKATHQVTAVATPLDAIADPLDSDVAIWLLSASGGNVDILASTEALVMREPLQVAVLCGKEDSALASLCREHAFVDLMIYPPPAGKDGFLATNSLLGFTTLIARAYAAAFNGESDWASTVDSLTSLLTAGSAHIANWEAVTTPLWSRPTTLVLHGPDTRIGAIDLESKFTEAAIGNLQVADYRNFAHGRHHWLAKRGEVSGVLAFVSDNDRALADRTLALIPTYIPQARVEVAGPPVAAALTSLVAALRLTGWAGAARGIDPGRPGVPGFGRKLYHLSLPKQHSAISAAGLSHRDGAAIMRKAGRTPERLAAVGVIDRWQRALSSFRDRLLAATFGGVVLDYDGTIVDSRQRFDVACDSVTRELLRLLEGGGRLAVATGRGASVRRDLRTCLPRALWGNVLIGYYNGAEVARLDADNVPDGREQTCDSLRFLAAALRAQPELAESADQTDRQYQITLQPKRILPENRLWELANQVICLKGRQDVVVYRSSHSIDILAPSVSKLNVLRRMREDLGDAPILTIGDRGRWPGNDYELLSEPFALSVDEISVDPDTCWNLALPGQRGLAVTIDYLAALDVTCGGLQFKRNALR